MALSMLQVLQGYIQGIFPMAQDGEIMWFDPDPRAIIPLDTFHVPRRLARTVHQGRYAIRFDTAFREVMEACAEPTPERPETWIDESILAVYTDLHGMGFAHSVETWLEGSMVGGLYGVSIRGLFAGESMFSRSRDASKVALVHLVGHLRRQNFTLLDVQLLTAHLQQFGAVEIARDAYRRLLRDALAVETRF